MEQKPVETQDASTELGNSILKEEGTSLIVESKHAEMEDKEIKE